jgi:hypothetical protein
MAHLFQRPAVARSRKLRIWEMEGRRRLETVRWPSENSRDVSIRERKAVTVKVQVCYCQSARVNRVGGPTPPQGPDPQSVARNGTVHMWRIRAWQSAKAS